MAAGCPCRPLLQWVSAAPALQALCRLWWEGLPVSSCEESCSSPNSSPGMALTVLWERLWGMQERVLRCASLNKGLQSLHRPSGSAPVQSPLSQGLPPDPNTDRIVLPPPGISWGEALHSEGGRGAGSAPRAPGLWPAHAVGATGPPVTTATGPATSGEGM